MDRRVASRRAAGKEQPESCPLVAPLRVATDVIDAAAQLVRSCARLIRAFTMLVLAVAILFVIMRTLW